MNPQELKELFWVDVEDVASGFELEIEHDCKLRLREFIDGGTERVAYEQLLNKPRRIGIAETNLIGFVGGMAFQARREHLHTLPVWTFDAAKKIFCPLLAILLKTMDEQRKKAFDFAQETSKQLITLATAIIGLTVTFGKDFAGNVHGFARILAIISWVLFLLSILFGLITLMALTGSLEPRKGIGAPSTRGSNVVGPACIQVLLFFFGLVAAVIFGIMAGHS